MTCRFCGKKAHAILCPPCMDKFHLWLNGYLISGEGIGTRRPAQMVGLEGFLTSGKGRRNGTC